MRLKCNTSSNSGGKYINQDNFCINNAVRGLNTPDFKSRHEIHSGKVFKIGTVKEWNLAAVADGVTNSYSSELCSEIVLKTLQRGFREDFFMIRSADDILPIIQRLLSEASEKLRENLEDKGGNCESAAALALAVFDDKTLFYLNLGDCTIKLLRDGQLTELSSDQSEGEVLTQYISNKHIGDPHFGITDLRNEDILILATDGIRKTVSPEREIHLAAEEYPAEALVAEAMENNCRDNVTAVSVKILVDK